MYLFGGCVTSWKVANGKDLLFVRPDAVFNKKKPIRFVFLPALQSDIFFFFHLFFNLSYIFAPLLNVAVWVMW